MSRFTPTRVGNIRAKVRFISIEPVHPHTRGEHLSAFREPVHPLGSPPHAWGTYGEMNPLLWFARFTPTRVGNIYLRNKTF